MSISPILLFTYNRPEHTRLTLEALKKNHLSDRSRLYIFSDGYRNETDREEVMKVRELVRSVEGFAAIHIEERTENVGLARNIIEGVTRVVNEHGKVIVLEDDLITSPYFLTFMNDVLERYEQEEKIAHVQGFCFPLQGLPDAFLIRWTGSWGWATWKRAWNLFNPDGEALLSEIMKKRLDREFDFNGNYPFTRMLRRQVNGENDSWAIRWNASLFLHNRLSVNAGKSLVQNIGFDGSGRHSGHDVIYTTPLHMSALSSEIPRIEENKAVRKAFEKYYRRTNSLLAKGVRRIKRILKG
ncbi:MAG TPA: glycosyltransferase [Proteiniphilum sp.]|nr:glycosyltransferase [Proteiniphilum sp.]HPD85964.1 glycosyltransferase [Proteiniphilum sp.]HPJ50130.1 glycosyltransferase [Proteiniphilum sp.]HPR19026.1 glycosyltransferase [Proteiniphilum sp.]